MVIEEGASAEQAERERDGRAKPKREAERYM
jgi:hypothetical protein